jgi:LAGLIDADG endonuclease
MIQQIKPISIHAPKAKKPQTDDQLGSFFAGLIDGNGDIDKNGTITIVFQQKDVSVAYYFKKVLGYGKIKQIQNNKQAYIYSCTHREGLKVIAQYIKHKLKLPKTIHQFNTNLVPKINCKPTQPNPDPINTTDYWLAGLIQARGSFLILTPTHEQDNHRVNIQMGIRINLKTDFVLQQIHQIFGGYVGSTPKDTYYYNSVNFDNVIKFINYLDRYQVMGATLTAYWLWRKASLRVQNKMYYTHEGLTEILNFKSRLTKLTT